MVLLVSALSKLFSLQINSLYLFDIHLSIYATLVCVEFCIILWVRVVTMLVQGLLHICRNECLVPAIHRLAVALFC